MSRASKPAVISDAQRRVVMVGPHEDCTGGVPKVVRDYRCSGLMKELGVKYIPTYRGGTKAAKIYFYVGSLARIFWALLMHRCDIVHLHSAFTWSFRRMSVIFFIAKLFRKRTVFHVHAGLFEEKYRAASHAEKMGTRFVLTKSDMVLALSDEWKAKLQGIAPKSKVRVLVNGIHLNKFPKEMIDRNLEPPYEILFLGRLVEAKGVYDLISAAACLEKGKFKFVLAGDGEINQVEELIKQKNLKDLIETPGWIAGTKKSKYLKRAHLYVLPSYHEGLPMSVLEAMGFYLPVIATPVGGIPQAVNHGINGYLVPCGEPDKLAESIARIVANETEWRQFSLKSREILEKNFGINRVKIRLSALYSELLEVTLP